MAKIKFSKTELKKQRDDLKMFTRFLPTLQLKKQQLQMEMMRMREQIEKHQLKALEFRESIIEWQGLFCTDEAALVFDQVQIDDVKLEIRNIAGVDIPVLVKVIFKETEYDLFTTSAWIDTGIETLKKLLTLEFGSRVLERQRQLLGEELRTTTQRVNLFEKVKIPEAKENIRRIQIYLGDQQTAAVGRAKIAKNKLEDVA